MGESGIGLPLLAELLQRQPLVGPGLVRVAVALDRLVEVLERGFVVAGRQIGEAAALERLGIARREGDGLGEIVDGRGVLGPAPDR